MKRFFFLFSLLIIQIFSSQIKDPVKFKFDVKPVEKGEYEAVLTGTIEDKWHIYSQDLPQDSGIPTEFKVSSKDGIQLIGKVQEIGKKHDEFSEAFGAQIVYYSNKVVFKQKFKPKDATKPATITAEIMFQTCNDRVCLAPNTLEFEKQIAAETSAENPATSPSEVLKSDSNSVAVPETKAEIAVVSPVTGQQQEGLKINSLDFKNPLTNCGTAQQKPANDNWLVLGLGFLGGLIALLTPCVFPMIPLTVSFFTKGSKNKAKGKRDAFIYGFFILLIFVL